MAQSGADMAPNPNGYRCVARVVWFRISGFIVTRNPDYASLHSGYDDAGWTRHGTNPIQSGPGYGQCAGRDLQLRPYRFVLGSTFLPWH